MRRRDPTATRRDALDGEGNRKSRNRAIAGKLRIGEPAVKAHISTLFQTFGVHKALLSERFREGRPIDIDELADEVLTQLQAVVALGAHETALRARIKTLLEELAMYGSSDCREMFSLVDAEIK